MKPLHQILAAALPYLYHPQNNPGGQHRICYAITRACSDGLITIAEEQTAALFVCSLIKPHAFLESWALEKGHIDTTNHSRTIEFVNYRDRWLAELMEAERSKLVEVRCCCDAGTLLGWIEGMPPELLSSGRVELPLRMGPPTYARVHLTVGEVQIPHLDENNELKYTRYRALKSDHLPIETLRRINGFKENELTSHSHVSGPPAARGDGIRLSAVGSKGDEPDAPGPAGGGSSPS